MRSAAMTIETGRQITAEDVLEIAARTGKRYEVVQGQLSEMAPTGVEHGGIETEVAFVLRRYLSDHPLGRAVTGEVFCRLQHNPETARAADVAFIRNEHLPEGRLPVGPFEGAPERRGRGRRRAGPPRLLVSRARALRLIVGAGLPTQTQRRSDCVGRASQRCSRDASVPCGD